MKEIQKNLKQKRMKQQRKVEDLQRNKKEQGITLIALVVTIVVLLILAGITINMLFGSDGIFKVAQDAANAWRNGENSDREAIETLENKINELVGSNITVEPGGLEVGSTVSYNPSGSYNWQAKYCSSNLTETIDDVLLSSDVGSDFNISSWKVLCIDENNDKVELVPNEPTKGKVLLELAQGYNNGVKLLNDACNTLYGDSNRGITARNINIEDIENYMTGSAVTEAHNYYGSPIYYYGKYGKQEGSYSLNSYYPQIYEKERYAQIDEILGGVDDLGLSEQETFIERIETQYGIGFNRATDSIKPFQSLWFKDASFMSTAFKSYEKENGMQENYYDIIIPKGTSTTYWISSRGTSIDYNSKICTFYLSSIYEGAKGGFNIFSSRKENLRIFIRW